MTAQTTQYRPETPGGWGVPQDAAGGSYGTDTLLMSDGARIFFRYGRGLGAQAPVLALLHLLGAHRGWYIEPCHSLDARGQSGFMDDRRGFGRYEGPRGSVCSAQIYLHAIAAFLDEVQKRHSGTPLVLVGHSMGGIRATYVALADLDSSQDRRCALIVVNPWVQDEGEVPATAAAPGSIAGKFRSAKGLATTPDTGLLATQSEPTQLLTAEAYLVRTQSEASLYQVSRLRFAMPRRASQVSARPLAIQTAGDRTLLQTATRRLSERLASADKAQVTYPSSGYDGECAAGRVTLDGSLADCLMQHQS